MEKRIILFNKPYGVLTQFTADAATVTLANYINIPHFYPAGRLDKNSEGLLVLTQDGSLQHSITSPHFKCEKTYWVQVEGAPNSQAINQLQNGVVLNDGLTRPARIKIIDEPALWPRIPAIRFRKTIPTAWLEIKLHEGRNHQVRRMTAKVGLPTLRLVRMAIGPWQIGKLMPGEWQFSCGNHV